MPIVIGVHVPERTETMESQNKILAIEQLTIPLNNFIIPISEMGRGLFAGAGQ